MVRILISLLILISASAQAQLTTDNLNAIVGEWTGTLTYLNYRDDKTLVTLPVEVTATNAGKSIDLIMIFEEPGGGTERRTDKIKLKKNQIVFSGDWDLGGATVQDNNHWEVEMSKEGMDNNLKSDFLQIMKVTNDDILITKKVRYRGGEFFMRNEYKLKRKVD
ncbi:MAG: hypothetical protein RIC80_08990 [Cyclobacteriaceae bacterium]